MPLPTNIETVILHGRYVELDGDPCFPGYVLFNSNVRLRNPNADVIIIPVSIRADLDSNGEFTVTLPTTNDPDNIPEDWTYIVTENLPNFSRTYGLKLPISLADPPAIVELADLSPTLGDDPSSPELTEIAWTAVTGKPTIFPPEPHGHVVTDVSTLQATLDGKAGVAHNHDSAYSATTHNHNSQYSSLVHSHSESDVIGLEVDLAGKSEVDHSHELVQALSPTQPATIFRGFDATQSEPVVSIQAHDGFAMADFDYGSVSFNVPINVPYFTVSQSFIIDGVGRRFYWSDADPDTLPLGIAPDGSLWIDGPNMLIKKKVAGVWQAQPVPVHTHAAADISSGTLDIARIPVGTSASTVAAGDHTHSTGAHTHIESEITNLTTDLANKAALVHTHNASDVNAGTLDVARLPNTWFRMSADFTTQSTSAVNVTGTSLTVPAAGTYEFRAVIFWLHNNTTAGREAQLRWTGTASASGTHWFSAQQYIQTSAFKWNVLGAWTTAITLVPNNAANTFVVVYEGMPVFSTSGAMQLQANVLNAADTLTVKTASFATLKRVA